MRKEAIAIIFEHKKIEKNLWQLIPEDYVIGCLESQKFGNKNIIKVDTQQYNCVNKANYFAKSFGYPLFITDYDLRIEKKAIDYFNIISKNKYFEIINVNGKKNFYRLNQDGDLLTTEPSTRYKDPACKEQVLLNDVDINLGNISAQDIITAGNLYGDGYSQEDIKKLLGKYCAEEIVDSITFKEKYDNMININKAYQQLSEIVISQDNAIKEMLVTIRNNLQKIELGYPVSNILLIGPTGVGKTLLAREVSKILGLPFVTVDSNNLTQMGYVGNNVSDCLTSLYIKAGCDLKLAQNGIIFIDEIDKLVGGDNSTHIKTTGVQDGLLKLLEGQTYTLEFGHKTIPFDSTNVTFIVGGAFDKITSHKFTNGVGFNASLNKEEVSIYNSGNIEKLLREYGLKSEFIGRLSKIIFLNELKIQDIKKIILSSHSIFNYYIELFKRFNIDFSYDDKFIESLAQNSLQKFGGARGINKLLESTLNECLWEIYNSDNKFSELIVDGETVTNPKKYILK